MFPRKDEGRDYWQRVRAREAELRADHGAEVPIKWAPTGQIKMATPELAARAIIEARDYVVATADEVEAMRAADQIEAERIKAQAQRERAGQFSPLLETLSAAASKPAAAARKKTE